MKAAHCERSILKNYLPCLNNDVRKLMVRISDEGKNKILHKQ